MLVFEEAQSRIAEVGSFSSKLEEVLLYLLKETQDIRDTVTRENEARKVDIEKKCKDLQKMFQDDNNKLKEIIKKENEERQRDMKDIEAYVKNENAMRKKETSNVLDTLKSEEEKRLLEAKALEDKLAREKRELEEYLKKDALEHKQKMEAENKAIKEKLDKEAAELNKKISDADDEKAEEMKILQNRLDNERRMLADKMEREKNEIAEEMERAEAERKSEATRLKNQMEEDKKQQENGIVTMFERMKGENETRKNEIHGLKDILVRENEKIQREQIALGSKLDAGLEDLGERLDMEVADTKKELKKAVDNMTETMKEDKKEIKDKIETDYDGLKRKVELETNELRDKMQFDKKAIVMKFDEVEDERQKEAKLIRTQLQKEREETRDTISSETRMLQDQMDGTTKDIIDLLKKEKMDREREVEGVKKRVDDERAELKATIDRDRDNMVKKMNEEHDQRRIEQLEVQQRLENNEKSGKNDMVEVFNRVKRYEEEARIDNDEVRQALNRTSSALEEKTVRDRKELREMLEHEANDLSRRIDKCNLERINESADMQAKVGLLGKSASRHLEHLKSSLNRETQKMIELAGKPGSVTFNAFRDEGHSDGGECYVTFNGCNVNIGGGFVPKSGMFQCPEPGLYMFTLNVCTYDGKKCLLILRKNEKDVCAMIDQDGNENRGKTMISQTCFMELDIGDRVQVYAVTGTGLTDTRNTHYTQFSGVLLRVAQETLRAATRGMVDEEDISMAEGSLRGFTPSRGFTPRPDRGLTPGPSNGDVAGQVRRGPSVTRQVMEEAPQVRRGPSVTRQVVEEGSNGHGVETPREDKDNVKKERTTNPTEKEVTKEEEKVPQQSYLALTKLGGPSPQDKKAENTVCPPISTPVPVKSQETPAAPAKSQGTPTTPNKNQGNPTSLAKSQGTPISSSKSQGAPNSNTPTKSQEATKKGGFYSFMGGK